MKPRAVSLRNKHLAGPNLFMQPGPPPLSRALSVTRGTKVCHNFGHPARLR